MKIADLFEQIDATLIEQWIRERKEESVYLEFKTADLTKRDDRKTYAAVVSGFANSDGGIVVWGVDARPTKDRVDGAADAKPIKPLGQFLGALNHHGDCVSPLLAGIQHKSIPVRVDEGYVVTLVPAGEGGPYMAKLGEDRYYKRSGDSFRVMEHFDIADMFGRRKRPRLVVSVYPRVISSSADNRRLALTFVLENRGRGSAYAPYLAVTPPTTVGRVSPGGVLGTGICGLPLLKKTDGVLKYGGSANDVIHPGEEREIDSVVLGVQMNAAHPPPSAFRFAVAAADCSMTEQTVVIAGGQLYRAAEKLLSSFDDVGNS